MWGLVIFIILVVLYLFQDEFSEKINGKKNDHEFRITKKKP